MEKFSKTILTIYSRQGGGAALPRKPTKHTITQPSKPSYTKTPTKELPVLGNHNQYREPPGNPPYTAIYQYSETPPTLHHSS
jgi:hypothetical protein